MDAEQCEKQLQSLKHAPLHLPRPGTAGEGWYLERWLAFVGAEQGLKAFERILKNSDLVVNQRTAEVAASFMVFMGCNGGQSFTYRCERYAASELFRTSRECAFLAAWPIENRRLGGVDFGLRTVEYMLAYHHPISDSTNGRARQVQWAMVPTISQDDGDTIECMVVWWAGIEAQKMRDAVQPMISGFNAKMLDFGSKRLAA